MTMTRDQIAALLRPGLNAIFSADVQYPTQWSEIFDVYQSNMAWEIDYEMKTLGLAQMRSEGAATALDDMGQRFKTEYQHQTYGLGLVITRNCIRDNLYKSKFPLYAKALKHSLSQRKERVGASILNNGFDARYPIGDGVPLFSAAHPIDGDTYSNTSGVATDLSQTALEDAITSIQQFKNQAGLISMTQPVKLIVPPDQQWVANVLLKSAYQPSTANNAVNPIFTMSAIPQGYRVNQFLNPKNWFILTDATDGFKHFVREKPETDVYVDWATDNLMAKAIESYSFGVSNPRAAYGAQATS